MEKKPFFYNLVLSILFCTFPVIICLQHFSYEHGFLGLIYFGREYLRKAIPEIQMIDPPTSSQYGYDGQFYAQIAISPLLSRDDLIQALDNSSYRARRIGMPAVAFMIGLGNTSLDFAGIRTHQHCCMASLAFITFSCHKLS